MRQCVVEQSTVVYRGTFGQMLPWLPTPGNKGFDSLTKGLTKYGLTPTSIEIEAPTNRLNDFVLTMSLLSDRLKLKLSYGWFEFLVSSLYEGDEPSILDIANIVLTTLNGIDSEVSQSFVKYQHYAHLKLEPSQAEGLLRENLAPAESSELVPDAFAYQIRWKELKDGEQARVIVARSLRVENGLFIDLTIDYVSPDEPVQMIARLNKDYERVLEVLGLEIL